MMSIFRSFIVVILLSLSTFVYAQSAHYQQGVDSFQKGEYRKALEVFKSIDRNENKYEIFSNIVRCYMGLDEYEKGIDYIDIFMKMNPDDPYVFLIKGLFEYYFSHFPESERYIKKAVSLEPERSDAWLFLGLLKIVLGKFEEARSCFIEAYKNNPDDGRILYYYNLPLDDYFNIQKTEKVHIHGNRLNYLERFEEAYDYFTAALENEPGNSYLKLKQVINSYHSGAIDTSLKEISEYLNNNPDDISTLAFKGRMLIDVNNVNDAIVIFEKITNKNPDLAEPWFYLGYCLYNNSRFDLAKNHFLKAIEMRPSNHIYFYYTGKTCYHLGEINEGVLFMAKAHLLKPNEESYTECLKQYVDKLLTDKENLSQTKYAP